MPVKHGALLGIPRVRFVQPQNLVVPLGINNKHSRGLIGGGQAIDSVYLKAQHISSAGVPRNRLALADIAKKMMPFAGSKLLNLQTD